MILSATSLALLGLLPFANAAPHCIRDNTTHWTNLASLPIRQQEQTTVVLDDTTIALVAGVGFVGDESMQTGVETINLVQLYDIPSDTWSVGTPAPFKVNHPNVAAVDGKIYLLGGLIDRKTPPLPTADWQASGESHVYDPTTDSWTQLESMPPGTERGSAVIGVHNEMIYLAGGMTILAIEYSDAVTSVIAFNTTSGSWQRPPPIAANIPEGRQHAVGAVYDDTFYVVGGRWFEKTNVRDTVFKLDLNDMEAGWTTSESRMPTPRGGICGAVVDGTLYTFGGEGQRPSHTGIFPNVEAFNLETEEWTELEHMPVPRHGTSAVSVGNKIYIPGGGLQDDGYPVEYEDGVVRFLNMSTHFDALVV